MAKTNPLFVDSTLLHGDRIGTQVELGKILPYDDEMVVAMITNQLGETQRIVMKRNEQNNYQARVWLGHQKSVTYYFVIEREGAIVLQTAPKAARAQYAIIDEWVPVLADHDARFMPSEKTVVLPPNSGKLLGDYVGSMATLIDKWGL
jgi:hypothetical protein